MKCSVHHTEQVKAHAQRVRQCRCPHEDRRPVMYVSSFDLVLVSRRAILRDAGINEVPCFVSRLDAALSGREEYIYKSSSSLRKSGSEEAIAEASFWGVEFSSLFSTCIGLGANALGMRAWGVVGTRASGLANIAFSGAS